MLNDDHSGDVLFSPHHPMPDGPSRARRTPRMTWPRSKP